MTKQVALAEATYARLRRNRRPGESFSMAIERLLDQAKDPTRFSALLPKPTLSPEDWRDAIDRGDPTVA